MSLAEGLHLGDTALQQSDGLEDEWADPVNKVVRLMLRTDHAADMRKV